MALPESFSLLVLGQGKTGLEVVRWALRHASEGARPRVTSVTVYGGASSAPNAQTDQLAGRGVRFCFGTEQVEGSYDVCVASPGISEFSDFFASARAASGQIFGEPELAWRVSPERWVAVTGTNGKTTTTALTRYLLASSGMPAEAVGNIGTCAISRADDRAPGSWFVAELSSYQLATTEELHPRAGVLLNITPDHLAWHRTHENYAAAKMRLFRNMGPDDLAVIDMDDPGAAARADEVRARGIRVCELARADTGAPDAAFLSEEGVLYVRLGGRLTELLAADELRIKGEHNQVNALAAAAVALFTGADAARVREGLASFSPLEHRIEPVASIDGVAYVNDSKATNTDAVLKALTAFPDGRVVLMLGGSDKGTPLAEFAREVARQVRGVVCFGAAGPRFLKAFSETEGASEIDLAAADHLADALDVARSIAHTGDTVLLSPACASFDEFGGFEERGTRFKELVAALASADAGEPGR